MFYISKRARIIRDFYWLEMFFYLNGGDSLEHWKQNDNNTYINFYYYFHIDNYIK